MIMAFAQLSTLTPERDRRPLGEPYIRGVYDAGSGGYTVLPRSASPEKRKRVLPITTSDCRLSWRASVCGLILVLIVRVEE